jgi:hypothetical protein
MRVISPQIKLNPGFEVGGRPITSSTVRLLTRAEREILNQIADLEEQNKQYFIAQINSFGGNEERAYVEDCAKLLVFPDEERLNIAMNDLVMEYRDPRFKSGKHPCTACGGETECPGAAAAAGQS